MTGYRPGSLYREAMLAAGAAASLAAVLLWLGPPGNDLAAHLYQRAFFIKHGFVLWNNFWYAGRYSFVTYSVLYYPLSALLGIKVLALASIAAAALGFALVVGREWGPAARWSSRTFAVVWAGTVLSAAFPFALGAALALLALPALQRRLRALFVLLVVLTLAASPLAFALLVVVLAGVVVARRRSWRRFVFPAVAVGGGALAELLAVRLFPDGARFPLLAVAAAWNVPPLLANFQQAAADPASTASYWQPAMRYLHGHLTPDYRVEVVDTLEHWPAAYFPEAGIPIVRGWYRQNDFPTNELLYDRPGPAAYRRWLRSLAVRYVVLSDAPPDYSSRLEAALLRRGVPGLRPVLRSTHLTVFELESPRPLITGPAPARVVRMLPTRLFLRVGAAGRYTIAVRFSPYWRTLDGCVARTLNGMTSLTAFRPGLIDLDFKVNLHRSVEVLTGLQPTRFCHA